MNKEYQQAPSASENIQPPKLRTFRALQFFALLCAGIWTLGAASTAHHIINKNFLNHLAGEEKLLIKEAGHVTGAVEQTMHQAEQLSKTLSFDRSIINLATTASSLTNNLEAQDPSVRRQSALDFPGAPAVNELLAQLARHVDMDQILLQDKSGFCISSSRSDQPDGCIGLNYFTRDYFQAALSVGSGRQFAIGRAVPTPSFFFSTAVKDNNNFVGAVVVRQKVNQIVNILSHQNLMVALTDKNGIVLSSNNENLLFQQIAADGQQMPSEADIQRTFKRDRISVLPFKLLAAPQPGLKLIALHDQRYILFRGELEAGDFFVYVFSPVDKFFVLQQKSWGLASILTVLGLLIILLIERNINYSQHRIAHLNTLSQANKHLAEASRELYMLSVTDALTGIANRRFFTQRLNEEIDRSLRNFSAEPSLTQAKNTLALLAIDIDFFKKVNDTYGHPAGDQAIRCLADICKQTIRPYDVLGRVGGEEFAILLSDTNAVQAQEIAERIRKLCENTPVIYNNVAFKQTCSIGVTLHHPGENAEQLLSKADRALYAAKNQGRNNIHMFTELSH